MFIPFLYLLRGKGLPVSLDQWITLVEALDKGLADSSLTSFYRLCRCVLLTSESDFDLFDEAFLEYFNNAEHRAAAKPEIPDQMLEWLIPDVVDDAIFFSPEHMEILRRLEEAILRLLAVVEKQAAAGMIRGNCEVCTGCGLCMGQKFNPFPETRDAGRFLDGGAAPQWGKNAFDLAEERNFRDFRVDTILETRQFQVAFRKLRQYSSRSDLPETEFDLEKTIDKTAQNAGLLHVMYGKPRRNKIKLMVLFDSDGSMWQHAEISNRLFQAANKTNHFSDLRFYYFHNCVYDHLYTSPACKNGEWEETEHVLRNFDGDYRVIYIADASMADSELFKVGGNVMLERSNRLPGIAWLKRLKRHYPRSVWLNPLLKTEWTRLYGGRTIQEVRRLFPMYELTVRGLENAVKKLLTAR